MKLAIKNVSKVYGRKKILKEISIELEEGLYGLLGPNGAGKTTLMDIIAGISKSSSGEVCFNGKSLRMLGKKYFNYIGYLPQEVGCYGNFTVYEFLRYMAAAKNIRKDGQYKRVDKLMEMVNMTEHKNKKYKTLSGGMKRMGGIAQALLNDPKILILDEPTAGLDPIERIRIKKILEEASIDRIVIISTHIVSDIEGIVDELVIIDNGKIIERGDVDGKFKGLSIEDIYVHYFNRENVQ